jgi:hypothetical protein
LVYVLQHVQLQAGGFKSTHCFIKNFCKGPALEKPFGGQLYHFLISPQIPTLLLRAPPLMVMDQGLLCLKP